MMTSLKALTRWLASMVDFEDILLGIALLAVVVGLWWIYKPAALIVPGAAIIGWSLWRHRIPRRR